MYHRTAIKAQYGDRLQPTRNGLLKRVLPPIQYMKISRSRDGSSSIEINSQWKTQPLGRYGYGKERFPVARFFSALNSSGGLPPLPDVRAAACQWGSTGKGHGEACGKTSCVEKASQRD